MKWLGVILAVLTMFLSGCSEQPPLQFTMPDSHNIQVIEVESPEPKMTEIVIEEPSAEEADVMQQWADWRARSETQDKHDAYIKAWNRDDEIEEKELELEDYCDSLFSNSCLNNIKEVCDHNGCRPVNVECDRVRDSDDVCVRYDISIGELSD